MCILAEEEHYTDKYDNLNYRALLNNKTVRNSYYDCFMEIAPCQTPVQKTLTSNVLLPVLTVDCTLFLTFNKY